MDLITRGNFPLQVTFQSEKLTYDDDFDGELSWSKFVVQLEFVVSGVIAIDPGQHQGSKVMVVFYVNAARVP